MPELPEPIQPGTRWSQTKAERWNNLFGFCRQWANACASGNASIKRNQAGVEINVPQVRKVVPAPPQYFARITGYTYGNHWFTGRRIDTGGNDIDQQDIEIRAIKLPAEHQDISECVPAIQPSEELTPESMVLVMQKASEWWVCNAIFQWTCFDDEGG